MGASAGVRRSPGTADSRKSAAAVRGAASRAELDAAYDLAAKSFAAPYGQACETKARLQRLDPVRSLDDAIVAVSGSEVIGFTRIVDRDVWLGGTPLKAGGVTSVCVHSAHQGQGVGRALVEAALARCRRRGDILAVTFARRSADGFYPKFGFAGLGSHPEMSITGGDADQGPVQGVSRAQGFHEPSIGAYAQAYEQSYGGLVLSFRRTGHWWAQLGEMVGERIGSEHWWTVLRQSAPVGYYVMRERRVVEAACVEGAEPALTAALAIMPGKLTLALPAEHAVVRACRGLNHTWTCRQSWDGGHMVRVLDGEAFMRAAGGGGAAGRLEQHDEAREFVLRAAGAGKQPALLTSLPAWSVLDEF